MLFLTAKHKPSSSAILSVDSEHLPQASNDAGPSNLAPDERVMLVLSVFNPTNLNFAIYWQVGLLGREVTLLSAVMLNVGQITG
jgi:hypothetical protein